MTVTPYYEGLCFKVVKKKSSQDILWKFSQSVFSWE